MVRIPDSPDAGVGFSQQLTIVKFEKRSFSIAAYHLLRAARASNYFSC